MSPLRLPDPRVIKGDGLLDPAGVQRNFDKLALAYSNPFGESRGATDIPTSESTTSTTYTKLATPDEVTVVLPTKGLLAVAYQALWRNTVASNARAAIFLGPNQLKGGVGTGAPVAQERAGPAEVNDDALLFTHSNGLGMNPGVGAATEVTTGQVVGVDAATVAGLGGHCEIFAAAGTYTVSIQVKNNAAGTLTVSKRHLWVWAAGFS